LTEVAVGYCSERVYEPLSVSPRFEDNAEQFVTVGEVIAIIIKISGLILFQTPDSLSETTFSS
jgi:hypothetical protein